MELADMRSSNLRAERCKGSSPFEATNKKEMKVNISYCSTKYYDRTNITQWMWMFKRHKYIKGFIMRIFGVYFNVRENNAFEKLLGIWKEQ